MEELRYQKEDRYFPLPENERHLQTVTAEHFLDVPTDGVQPGNNILEGICFDRDGNMYFCNSPMGWIYFVDMKTKKLRMFKKLDGMNPSAIKIHKNGDLYITMAASKEGSLVLVLHPDGTVVEKIPMPEGHFIDDMVFDDKGGFYLSDLGGSIADKTAGIYYMEPDHKTLHTVVPQGMIASNGIALTPDGKHLWVTEYGTALLHWFGLSEDGFSATPFYSYQPYHFTGMEGPDSICIDRDGNLYVSICGQGRFLVFNQNGVPIGNILIPGREEGRMLKSTHIAIAPGTKTAYMCTADLNTGKSAIYRAGVYAPNFQSYQFQ